VEGARGEKGKERREASIFINKLRREKSPAWSSQNLGSTAYADTYYIIDCIIIGNSV